MSALIKNLLFALALAVIVWLGYVLFIKESDDMVTESNAALTSEAVRDGQEFLAKLQQLRAIDLSGHLFKDPRFQSLIDVRQDIVSEPVGRANPFIPVLDQGDAE